MCLLREHSPPGTRGTANHAHIPTPCPHPCHSPITPLHTTHTAVTQGLIQAKKMGLTRAIGVSNFGVAQLESLKGSSETPAVNQIPLSIVPFWGSTVGHDDALLTYCADHTIVPQSYGSLRGCPFTDARLVGIAAAHKVTPSQACMRWVLQRGAVLAAGTGSNSTTAPQYSRENIGIFDFALTAAEMGVLNSINGTAM